MKLLTVLWFLAIGPTLLAQNCEISCDPRCTQCHGGGGDLIWVGNGFECGGCPPTQGGGARPMTPQMQSTAKRFSPTLNANGIGAALAAEVFNMLRGPRVPLKAAIPAHTPEAMRQVQARAAQMSLLGVQCKSIHPTLALFR